MDRRRFLTNVGALTASSALARNTVQAQEASSTQPILTSSSRSVRYSDREIEVPDGGWRLWLDRGAAWKDDRIFLPEDVHLDRLPVNPPTGGWSSLGNLPSLEVTLPATVEQFFWGINGYRSYKDEYKFEDSDSEVKNGSYLGVSWWWRSLDIPAGFAGSRILLHVRGARQRAEVYLNQQLVGYSILEELSFECDLTKAARPGGANQLAIRITNPGGRLDWVDKSSINWGGLQFQKSHGFAGIDRGLVLSAHDPAVRFTDTWALNTPTPKQIQAHASIENNSAEMVTGTLRLSVLEAGSRMQLTSVDLPVSLAANEVKELQSPLTAATAAIWDLETPHVYRLRAEWISPHTAAARETDFGFRWITVDGLGSNAVIRLNARRIRIYTSISWGFWALNGLFPTPELAEKEVRVAKQFNLNTLNFHRNLAKEDVLYVQDRVGLMRCLEPGGGGQALDRIKNGDDSSRRYMEAKITHMIRAFRSHPSVVHYIIQNEVTLDPQSPVLTALFARMQTEDPSRTIVGNDGFVMRSPQAWAEPYSKEIHKSGPKAAIDGGAGGWWVDHTGHSTDVWQDGCYLSPSDFYYRSPIKGEIVEWGEMKGAASSDNHEGVLRQIARHGGSSYDLIDHKEILASYNAFLDRWNFRAAFPTAEKLFLSIGLRAYESWGQFMENVRICDENDMAAISGWESTAMENHSGLVDNFRDFKADPSSLADSLLPLRPIAKQHQLVVFTGERASFDLYLLNDTDTPATGKLSLTLASPDGEKTAIRTTAAPDFVKDRLSYLLEEKVQTPKLLHPGTYKTEFSLNASGAKPHTCTLLVVDPAPAGLRPVRIGIAGVPKNLEACAKAIPHATVEAFNPAKKYDVILASGGTAESAKDLSVDAEGAYKPGSGPLALATLPDAVLAAVQGGTPLFAITPTDGQSIGVAQQLQKLGAFDFKGMVGASRASWMGAWYFVRKHPLYDGLPVDQALGTHYQVKSGGSNGWMVDGANVEVIAGYSRDHDRNIGAGTFVAKVGSTRIVMHRIADMHQVFLQRFMANTVQWLVA
jgi:beta-galactosidase